MSDNEAKCMKCGEVSSRHMFPGGGQYICPERLKVGFYSTTDAFRAIHQHVAVMRPDGSLVAVTGPSTGPGAMEAIAVAHRFAASDELLAVLKETIHLELGDTYEGSTPEQAANMRRVRAAIAKAEGKQS